VRLGRGSKQSNSSRKIFPSKNLANMDSCSMSVRSQDESMAIYAGFGFLHIGG
jgi:hypothetical protein